MKKVLLLVIIVIIITPIIGMVYIKAPDVVAKQDVGKTDRYINSARVALNAMVDILQFKTEESGTKAKTYLQTAYKELETIGVPADKLVGTESAIDSYISNPSNDSLEAVKSKANGIIQEAINVETDIQIKSFRLIIISLIVLFTICMSLICATTNLIY